METFSCGTLLRERLRKTPIIKHKDQVDSVCFSPDGTMLASSADLFEEENNIERFQGAVVHLWDVDTGEHLKTFRHEMWVHYLCFSPDGTILASSDGGSKGKRALMVYRHGTTFENPKT